MVLSVVSNTIYKVRHVDGKIVESCSNRLKGGLGRGRHFQGDMVSCMRTVMPKSQDWCKRVLTSLKASHCEWSHNSVGNTSAGNIYAHAQSSEDTEVRGALKSWCLLQSCFLLKR